MSATEVGDDGHPSRPLRSGVDQHPHGGHCRRQTAGEPRALAPLRVGAADRAARALLWRLLGRAGSGRIEITEDGGPTVAFGPDGPDRYGRPALSVRARIHDARTYRAVLTGGSAGLGEAYLKGWWDVDDLTGFLRLLSREVHRYDPARNRVAHTAGMAADRLRARRKQDKRRDRANIAAHYDLSNDFFSLMLDETMMYSSAVFATPSATLAEASTHKLDLLCRRLDLGPDDHVVEIGTGWGGFAVHAAARYGCRVTTTTISRAQFAYATAAGGRSRAGPPRRGAQRRLPRPHRHLRQARVHRDDRGGRLARARHLLRRLPATARPRRRSWGCRPS